MYDYTYKGLGSATLPGDIRVQFVSPTKNGITIEFAFRGSAGEEEAALFHKLLHNHTDPAKSEDLEPAQINKLAHLLGNCVGDNQYNTPHRIPNHFIMTSVKIISLNNNIPVLSVEGEYKDEITPGAFLHLLYLEGSGDVLNIDMISLGAPTKEAFVEAKPIFDQVLKTLTW